MKTKSVKSTSQSNRIVTKSSLGKRRELLESYFSNALVLAALLETAQKDQY